MADKLWKAAERRIADSLGGRRVPVSGRQRGDSPDIEHDLWSIEVKQRAKIPKLIHDAMDQAIASMLSDEQVPIVVLHQTHKKYADDYVIVRMRDFKDMTGLGR